MGVCGLAVAPAGVDEIDGRQLAVLEVEHVPVVLTELPLGGVGAGVLVPIEGVRAHSMMPFLNVDFGMVGVATPAVREHVIVVVERVQISPGVLRVLPVLFHDDGVCVPRVGPRVLLLPDHRHPLPVRLVARVVPEVQVVRHPPRVVARAVVHGEVGRHLRPFGVPVALPGDLILTTIREVGDGAQRAGVSVRLLPVDFPVLRIAGPGGEVE